MALGWEASENWKQIWNYQSLSKSQDGSKGWFLSSLILQGSSVSETPRDAINTDSSSGPFDTLAFEGPGRESSLYVVRIKSLYTQTINSSMDSPVPWKGRPCFPGSLGLHSVLKEHQCFWGFVLFCFVILKSLSLRIVRAGWTLSSAWHLSPLASECQSGIKKPNTGSFEQCHWGSKWLPAVCAWARPPRRARNCAVTQTRCLYRLLEPMQRLQLSGPAPAKTRPGLGVGSLRRLSAVVVDLGSFQGCLADAEVLSKSLLSLRLKSLSLSAWCHPAAWLVVRKDEESHLPGAEHCKNVDLSLETFSQVYLMYLFQCFQIYFSPFSVKEKWGFEKNFFLDALFPLVWESIMVLKRNKTFLF